MQNSTSKSNPSHCHREFEQSYQETYPRTKRPLFIASQDIYHRVQQQFLYYVIGSKNGFGTNVGDRIEIVQLLYDTISERAIAECRIVVENGGLLSGLSLISFSYI